MTTQMRSSDAWRDLRLNETASLPSSEVLALVSSAEAGLSAQEAAGRLAAAGPNAIRSHGAQPLEVLLRQLRSPLLLLLTAAAVTSFVVGERTDALIILGIIALSVGLGFVNEYRAARAVEALHSRIRHTTSVIRDKELVGVPARRQRTRLGFPIADDAEDDEIGVVVRPPYAWASAYPSSPPSWMEPGVSAATWLGIPPGKENWRKNLRIPSTSRMMWG